MENTITVIDHLPPDAETSSIRKLSFRNLTEKQKSYLMAASAGVGGISFGAMAVVLTSSALDNDDNTMNVAESEAGNNDIEVRIESNAPFSGLSNDNMSFDEAFRIARNDVGAGGFFEWRGQSYNTFYKEEWDAMSSEERNDFFASIDHSHTSDKICDEQEILAILNDRVFDDHEDIVILEDPFPDTDMLVNADEEELVIIVEEDEDIIVEELYESDSEISFTGDEMIIDLEEEADFFGDIADDPVIDDLI